MIEQYNPEDLEIDAFTMKQFLSQTAMELSNIDRNIISSNQHLAPKRMEFEQTARRILSNEIIDARRNAPSNQQFGTQPQPPQVSNPQPFIDTGVIRKIDNDPNQLEFKFDNSVTAITINNKLVQLEKFILSIDKKVQKLLELMDDREDTE